MFYYTGLKYGTTLNGQKFSKRHWIRFVMRFSGKCILRYKGHPSLRLLAKVNCDLVCHIRREGQMLRVFENRVLRKWREAGGNGRLKSFMICTPHQILLGNQIKNGETCGTYGEKSCIPIFVGNTKQEGYLDDPRVPGIITSKWILKKQDGQRLTALIWPTLRPIRGLS